jgi:2-polyprenyl-3-methyl-5-hydroxy-6-metoxy-1,4-benzoquinol methylase
MNSKSLTSKIAKAIFPFNKKLSPSKPAKKSNSVSLSVISDVKETFRKRSSELRLRDDYEFAVKLHKLIPLPPVPAGKYEFDNLFAMGKRRFLTLEKMGINLKDKKILDLGASNGECLIAAHEFKIAHIDGLDYSSEKFQSHRERVTPSDTKINFIESDISKAILPSEQYDVVLSYNCFEHFHEPEKVLQSCWHTLKPGGLFYSSFGPLFLSARGAHRYSRTGIPFIQNIFSREVAFDLIYKYLNSYEGKNSYTGEQVTNLDPYPEMNKWSFNKFQQLFKTAEGWDVVSLKTTIDSKHDWFIDIFENDMNHVSLTDLKTESIQILLRKISN